MRLTKILMTVGIGALVLWADGCTNGGAQSKNGTASSTIAPSRPGAASGDSGPAGDQGTGMVTTPGNPSTGAMPSPSAGIGGTSK